MENKEALAIKETIYSRLSRKEREQVEYYLSELKSDEWTARQERFFAYLAGFFKALELSGRVTGREKNQFFSNLLEYVE